MLLVKPQDDLHPSDLVERAELDGLGGTKELHRINSVMCRDTDVFEVEPRYFVLKQNFHRHAITGFLVSTETPLTTTNCGQARLVSLLIVQIPRFGAMTILKNSCEMERRVYSAEFVPSCVAAA